MHLRFFDKEHKIGEAAYRLDDEETGVTPAFAPVRPEPRYRVNVTPDPIGLEGGVNLYGYVGNNPMNWTDLRGLSQDVYVPDNSGSHGGPHVDRYSPGGQNVGRYRPSREGIPHKGKCPPEIPKSDIAKFEEAVKGLRGPFMLFFEFNLNVLEQYPFGIPTGVPIDQLPFNPDFG